MKYLVAYLAAWLLVLWGPARFEQFLETRTALTERSRESIRMYQGLVEHPVGRALWTAILLLPVACVVLLVAAIWRWLV